jgi:hypothetical protein
MLPGMKQLACHPCRSSSSWSLCRFRVRIRPAPGRRDGLPRSAQAATAALDCGPCGLGLLVRLPSPRKQPGDFVGETRAARRWVPWICAYTGTRALQRRLGREHSMSAKGGPNSTTSPSRSPCSHRVGRRSVVRAIIGKRLHVGEHQPLPCNDRGPTSKSRVARSLAEPENRPIPAASAATEFQGFEVVAVTIMMADCAAAVLETTTSKQ